MTAKRNTGREGGRNAHSIDWKQVENCFRAGCNVTEAAQYVGISDETLRRHYKAYKQKETGLEFVDYVAQFKGKGSALRKVKAMDMAMSGNVVMNIFLLKNLEGYADKVDQKVDNTHSINDKQVQIIVKPKKENG